MFQEFSIVSAIPILNSIISIAKQINIPIFSNEYILKKVGHQWLTPVILPTWESEIQRIAVQGLA
jgi:type III secretion system FlhB-like substrate exporter